MIEVNKEKENGLDHGQTKWEIMLPMILKPHEAEPGMLPLSFVMASDFKPMTSEFQHNASLTARAKPTKQPFSQDNGNLLPLKHVEECEAFNLKTQILETTTLLHLTPNGAPALESSEPVIVLEHVVERTSAQERLTDTTNSTTYKKEDVPASHRMRTRSSAQKRILQVLLSINNFVN